MADYKTHYFTYRITPYTTSPFILRQISLCNQSSPTFHEHSEAGLWCHKPQAYNSQTPLTNGSSNLNSFASLLSVMLSEVAEHLYLTSISNIVTKFNIQVLDWFNAVLQLSAFWPHLYSLQAAPTYLWCGSGHRHRQCLDKNNEASKPKCCICKAQHPSSYRGCSCAKKEQQRRRLRSSSVVRTGSSVAS
jgi:hypothetical protein